MTSLSLGLELTGALYNLSPIALVYQKYWLTSSVSSAVTDIESNTT